MSGEKYVTISAMLPIIDVLTISAVTMPYQLVKVPPIVSFVC